MTRQHACPDCGDIYPSMRAAFLCEERDIAEARDARRPSTRTVRRVERWDND